MRKYNFWTSWNGLFKHIIKSYDLQDIVLYQAVIWFLGEGGVISQNQSPAANVIQEEVNIVLSMQHS